MSDDDHVDAHRLEIPRRVDERFALRYARTGRCDVHRVGRETFLGEFEGHSRACRCLEEQIDDRRAAQRRNFLDGAFADFLEGLGSVENELDLIARQWLERQQILAESRCHVALSFGAMMTASRSSSSFTRTSMREPAGTVTTLPTTSG